MSQEWLSALDNLTQTLRGLLPNVLAATALILFGLLLARLFGSWSRRLTAGALERLARSNTVQGALERTNMSSTIPKVVAAFVFWLVFLFFTATALEALGLPVVTDSLGRFVYYLPNVLAAALIVAAGMVVATVARGLTTTTAASAGVAFASALGRLAHGVILAIAIVIALDELGIDSGALIITLAVTSGSVLAGLGLAFGLGAHTSVSNIIASHYLAQAYTIGQTVKIGDVEGQVAERTPTALVIVTEAGRVMVPAKKFAEESSTLVGEGS
jgi:small-conductance mechanosensitive channel